MVSGRDCERGNPHGSSPAQTDCCSHESSVHGDFPTGSAVQQSAPASQSVTALHHFPSANQCSAQSKINRSCIGGNKYLRWGYYCSICSRPPQQKKIFLPTVWCHYICNLASLLIIAFFPKDTNISLYLSHVYVQ